MRSELTKHTVNLRPGDMQYLQEVYGPRGIPASQIIRMLVSRHVDQLRGQVSEASSRIAGKEPTQLALDL